MSQTYTDMFTQLQTVVRSLESESIGIDDLEREIGRAYDIIDTLQERLEQTSFKVEAMIQVKETGRNSETESSE